MDLEAIKVLGDVVSQTVCRLEETLGAQFISSSRRPIELAREGKVTV